MDEVIETTAEYAESAVLARCHEVHVDPNTPCTEIPDNLINENAGSAKSPAQWAYERLILYIQNFEKTLDNEHEVAMGFAGGSPGTLRIEGMGYFDPDIVTFYGSDPSGAKTQLIQHVSQLGVMLRALPKPPETSEPARIGFRLAQDLETSA
ncbi:MULTISPECIES: hypothetical protein [Roseovarius]|jgi:hypothetical protein|uniref:hypothetical protein n=1 Tax=Roseovarius TaxID=74030 RepID=UPI00273EACEE|nr:MULTISPECIES: hypothetical protein [unclassified Roseovarius]